MMARMKTVIAVSLFALVAVSVHAQTADAGYTATVARSWQRVSRLVVASAEAMPDAGYAFKPTADVRSFGELIGHLAEEHYMICSGVKGEKNPKDGEALEK